MINRSLSLASAPACPIRHRRRTIDYYRQHIKLNLRTEIGKPEADIQLVMTTESVAAQNIERIQRRSRDQGPNAPTGTTTTPSSRR